MKLGRTGMSALRELARRRPTAVEPDGPSAQEAAAALRAFYYPKQAAFFASRVSKWRSTRKARRAGITTGGIRELLARALELPDFRATYMATTRDEAIARAWRSDTKSGLIDVLSRYGKKIKHRSLMAFEFGGLTIDVGEAALELNFSNGSQIALEGAADVKLYDRKRGGAKHVWWIDEAQGVSELESLFDSVVLASLSDHDGEAWLTGTPGRDCVGMFYDITKEDDGQEVPLANWDVHELLSTDNPFFGRVLSEHGEWFIEDNIKVRSGPFGSEVEAEQAAWQVRWDRTAGDAMRKKGWKGDEPDFVREWLGRWVKTDARFVYPVHSVPKHVLVFAPQRLADNPFIGTHDRFKDHPRWYDHHAAVNDLPRPKRGHGTAHHWLYSLGVDFGYNPDPFALILWAFAPDLTDIYEMFSWKCTRVHTDDQALYMRLIWDAVSSIVSFVGDPAGKQDDFEVWRSRMNLPIEEANKKGKNTLEEFLADDIRRGRVHMREDSPLYTEARYLVYLPGKPGKTREVHKHRKVNGVVHGDHVLDAARYSFSDLTHYLAKLPKDKPPPGSREAYAAEAEHLEKGVETAEQRRAAELMERDEQIQTYGGDAYEWQ